MNRVKFLGVVTDVHSQPTGTIWRMSDNWHMTTLVIPNERLYQLLDAAEQRNRWLSGCPLGAKPAQSNEEPSQ